MNKAVSIGLRVLIVGAIVYFLGTYIWRNGAELRALEFSFRVGPFLASTALIAVMFLQQAVAWWFILRELSGNKLPLSETLAVWFASQAAKYVPGRVMLPLVRMSLCKRRGIDLGRTTISIYLELSLMTGTAILLAILSSLDWSTDAWRILAGKLEWPGSLTAFRYAVFALIPATAVAIHPRVLAAVINLGLRLVKKGPVRLDLSYPRLLLLGVTYLAGWFAFAVSSWLLLRAVGFTEPAFFARAAGAFTIAWVIGFLSFITPGGIGVREAILTGLLAVWGVPVGIGAVVAILGRLQWTGLEFVGAALTVRYRPPVVEGTDGA